MKEIKQAIWSIAYVFKFSPNDIWEMTVGDFLFWLEGCNDIMEEGNA